MRRCPRRQMRLRQCLFQGVMREFLLLTMNRSFSTFAEIHLSGLGYSVTTKTKSTEALAAFLADPDCFDLVITDQTMPDVTGAELAQTLLKIKPDLPIILYTGYTSALSEEDAYGLGIKSFIEKPVSKEILSRTVRRLLDGGALQNHVLKN